jgi:hypothetical protein
LQWDNERWRWIDYQILNREYNTNICQYLPWNFELFSLR